VARRLPERLEQRVLGRDAERLGVVDNRDAPRAAARARAQPGNKLAHLLDQHFAAAFSARNGDKVGMHTRGDLHARRATLASPGRRGARTLGAATAPRRFSSLAHRAILDSAAEAGPRRALAQERVSKTARDHRL